MRKRYTYKIAVSICSESFSISKDLATHIEGQGFKLPARFGEGLAGYNREYCYMLFFRGHGNRGNPYLIKALEAPGVFGGDLRVSEHPSNSNNLRYRIAGHNGAERVFLLTEEDYYTLDSVDAGMQAGDIEPLPAGCY